MANVKLYVNLKSSMIFNFCKSLSHLRLVERAGAGDGGNRRYQEEAEWDSRRRDCQKELSGES